MIRCVRVLGSVVGLLMAAASTALAQKSGGILKIYTPDSPASMSILEEATTYAVGPMMGVFNNLVVFNQSVKQNSLHSIVPDLATEWFWNEDGTGLTFRLRQGVKWHDGQPFTAKDVVCTYDLLMEKGPEKLRVNPRLSVFKNLDHLSTNGDFEVTFHLKRPQPAFLMLISGGTGAVYPCHISPEKMRRQPIGTGPFKFVDYKANQYIKVMRNPNYWKPGRPYLDGIEYTIIKSMATAMMGLTSGTFDMAYPYSLSIPIMKDLKRQAPSVVCEITPGTVNRHLLVNRSIAPFDNRDVRLAMALALDRQAFIDILAEGQGDIGAVLQPAPGGLWGMPPDMLRGPAGIRLRCEDEPPTGPRPHGEARLRAGQAPQGQAHDPRPLALSRSQRDPARPVEGGPYRQRAGAHRDRRLFSQNTAQGLHRQPQPADQRPRSRSDP